MNTRCWSCEEVFSLPWRGWYDRNIAKVCSSACFKELLIKGQGIDPLVADERVQLFQHSDRSLRSNYEREFMAWLRRNQLGFLYEPYVFRLRNGKGYVPDFFVAQTTLIEVKGRWTTDGRAKFKAFRDQFHEMPIFVADLEFIQMLKRTEKK